MSSHPDLPVTEVAKAAAGDVLRNAHPHYVLSDEFAGDVLFAAFPYLIAGLAEDEAAVERVAKALAEQDVLTDAFAEQAQADIARALANVALRALGGDDG